MPKQRKRLIRLIAAVLSAVLIFPCNVFAAQPEAAVPLASSYITSYSGGISPQGNGKLRIDFSITATGKMDDLGITSIVLYESEDNYDWFAVKTYYSSSYTGLMTSNAIVHSGSITYQGTAGCYYEAHICYYAGDETGSDTAQMYTTIMKAN